MDHFYCKACGYSLRYLQVSRCPECGRVFDPNDANTFVTTPHAPSFWIKWALPAIRFPLTILTVLAFAVFFLGDGPAFGCQLWMVSLDFYHVRFGSMEVAAKAIIAWGSIVGLVVAQVLPRHLRYYVGLGSLLTMALYWLWLFLRFDEADAVLITSIPIFILLPTMTWVLHQDRKYLMGPTTEPTK